MLRTGTMARLAAGLTGMTIGLALLAVSLTATAAPRGGPGTPGVSAVRLAAEAAAPTTITSQYSCDLSGYGSGIPAVTVSGTLTIPGSVVAGEPLDISLSTEASTALPAAVVTALSGITEFAYSGSVTQEPADIEDATATPTPTVSPTTTGTPSATATPTTSDSATPSPSATTTPDSSQVPLNGVAQAPATLTSIPAATATGAAKFALTGTGIIVAPATTLTITPVKTTGALAAISCTTTDAARNVSVNVTPQTVGTAGPVYTCKESLADQTDTIFVHVDSRITASGKRTVGKTQTVTYTTPTFGSASWPPGTTRVDYTGSLPVTGAQPGKISLNRQIDLSARELKLPGKLKLTKAGTDHVEVPAKFTLTMQIPELAASLTLTCTINATPPPTGLSLAVGGTGPTPSHTASSSPAATSSVTPGGQPQGSAAPSGAPDTGGGPGPAGTVPMAVAGSAMAMAGAGLMLTARRRRGRRA